MKFRLKALSIHFLISALVISIIAFLVFKLWYPYPFRELTGGLQLFTTIALVDLVCGPLLTFVLANQTKSRRELVLDFIMVGVIQLSALMYGLYSIKNARPVLLSFERDRMTIVTAAEIDMTDIENAPKGMRSIPLFGMKKIGIRRAQNEKEFFESVNLGLEGIEPSVRPSWWLPFEDVLPELQKSIKPLSELTKKQSDNKQLQDFIQSVDMSENDLFYIPLTSQHQQNWIIIMNKDAEHLGYLPIDGFK